MPMVEKMYTDSGAPVNLKKSVWPRIAAAPSWQIQLTIRAPRPSSITASIVIPLVESSCRVGPPGGAAAAEQGPQPPHARRPGARGPRCRSDLEQQPPLGPEGPVRLEQPRAPGRGAGGRRGGAGGAHAPG